MTTAQLDHLRAIDAHLAKLLAIASKRTPGEWAVLDHSEVTVNGSSICELATSDRAWNEDVANAAFIASCAGNAEAGWIDARSEIADLIAFDANCRGWKNDNGCVGAAIQYIQLRMAKILAAFPLESLNS